MQKNHDNDRVTRLPGTVCGRIERMGLPRQPGRWGLEKKIPLLLLQTVETIDILELLCSALLSALHKPAADCAQESGMTEMGRLDAAAGGVG